jgi:hypothetical protein
MSYEVAGIITSDELLKMRKKLLFHWLCLGFNLLPLPQNGNGGNFKTEAFIHIEMKRPPPSVSLISQPSMTPSILSSPSMSQSLSSLPSSSLAPTNSCSWANMTIIYDYYSEETWFELWKSVDDGWDYKLTKSLKEYANQ